MFGRVVAVWLVLLTFSPFTAPFPTCDLNTLFAGHAPALVSAPSQARSLADSMLAQVLPLIRPSQRVRFAAFAVSKAAAAGSAVPAAALEHSVRPPDPNPHRATFATLRI